jgi:uncharacterized protein (TIGR02300 family)
VAKPEWGRKHRCDSCGAQFYDLTREPAACPKCGAVAAAETKPRRSPPKAKPPAPVDGAPKLVEIEVKDDADQDAEPIEDASELGADDKDVVEVIPPDDERSQAR